MDSITYINNLIEAAQKQDLEEKRKAISEGKGSRAMGESFWVYNLKTLKDLITNEKRQNNE